MNPTDDREIIWTNPSPLGKGRRESLLAVMKAMIEGKELDAATKVAINDIWIKVLSGEKKLEHLSCLIEGREPPAEEAQPVTVETERTESGEMFV